VLFKKVAVAAFLIWAAMPKFLLLFASCCVV